MCEMSSPLNLMVPDVGSRSRITARPMVDFPQPDSPTSPTVSPALTSRSRPSTAWTYPVVRWRTPDAMGNHTLRSETEMSGSLVVHARVSFSAVASGTLQLLSRLGDPARGHLGLTDPLQRRCVSRAALDAEGAAGMEGAAG